MSDQNDQLRSSLPLIRLSLLKPFADYLDQRQVETGAGDPWETRPHSSMPF